MAKATQTRPASPVMQGSTQAAPAAQEAPANGNATTALARRSALPVVAASSYAIIQLHQADDQESRDLQEAMLANLGDGGQLSAFDFDRIRVPAGGGIAWEIINTATGAVEPAIEFVGILSSWNDQKSYWKQGIDEEGATKGPPNCFSTDCIKGQGDPGIECARCPHNVFGTAKKGRGKACKDSRLLFVMREESLMPDLVIVPPTSLKNVKKYFQLLMSRGIPFYRAITRFKLAKDRNAGGVEYSKIELSLVGILPGEEFPIMRKYSNNLTKMLGRSVVQVRIEDLQGGEQGGGDTLEGSIAGDALAGGDAPAGGADANI